MGDLCMRVVMNIVSFLGMVFGLLVSAMSKYTHLVDDSITLITACIGLAGAVIWVFIALFKLKREKIETKISEIELSKLESEE